MLTHEDSCPRSSLVRALHYMYNMSSRFCQWAEGLIFGKHAQLAIVRRYVDMNGRHVGELYAWQSGLRCYVLLGASLDTLPIDATKARLWRLDTRHSFLDRLAPGQLRVGGQCPADDRAVRRQIRRRLRGWLATVLIENRFIYEDKGIE